ncbi:MAG: hypothetical protein ACTH9F_03075 [Brachybacterium tyrofermentans]
MRFLIPDTSLAWNFHELGRIDLIGGFVGRSALQPCTAEWGLEVEREVLRLVVDAHDELQQIFGESVKPTPTQQTATRIVRERAFRRIGDDFRSHTGEAETIAIWSDRAGFNDTVICLTEDISFVEFCWRTREAGSLASSYADGRQFTPVTTDDILESCLASTLITQADKLAFVRSLRAAGRPYVGPAKNFR